MSSGSGPWRAGSSGPLALAERMMSARPPVDRLPLALVASLPMPPTLLAPLAGRSYRERPRPPCWTGQRKARPRAARPHGRHGSSWMEEGLLA